MTVLSNLAAPQCDHTWHAGDRCCWVVWHVDDLSAEQRQASLHRLRELQGGDYALLVADDVRARGRVVATTDHLVVIETLDGQIAVVNVAAARLIIV